MHRKLLHQLLSVLLLGGMLLGGVQPGIVQASAPAEPLVLADPTAKIEPLVLEELQAEGMTDFFVWMVEKADLSPAYGMQTKEEKGQFVFETLVSTADRTQASLRAYLDSQGISYQSFYIANKVFVVGGNLELVLAIAERQDVAEITANHQFQLEEPFRQAPALESPEAIESNIIFINADDVWALGITGSGTVLAGNDTGLDETHPAIARHYRGCLNPPTCSSWDHNYNWWDATDTYPADPFDGHGHGTHTTGTMVGDDGGTNQIGVAPGAQTVHCKNMTNSGSGTDATFTECFQWDLAPWDLNMANPRPDLAPDAINNSWGYSGGNRPVFRDEVQALHAAGILVEVSAGNEGATCQTLRSPGDYLEVLTTGSVQHTAPFPGTITGFSSRGPSDLDPSPPNYFPDIMAPGENIRSSLPGNSYASWDGTSMAGPHATALVGLVWSACPVLQGQVYQTIDLIHQTAARLTGQGGSNCGGDYTTGPNNDWGFGTIDALAAVNLAVAQCSGLGNLDGTVRDSVSLAPIENVNILAAWEGGTSWTDLTDASGYYTFTVPNGTYTVTASRLGYMPSQLTGISVLTNTVTTVDINLVPRGTLSGFVTDQDNSFPLEGALVTASDGTSDITDATGYYEMFLDPGGYVVTATMTDYAPESANVVIVSGATTNQFFSLLAAISVVPDPILATVTFGGSGGVPVVATNNLPDAYPFHFTEMSAPGEGNVLVNDILLMGDDLTAAEWDTYRLALTAAGVTWDERNLDTQTFPTLAELSAYTLLIWADEDTLVPGDTQCQIVADWLVSGNKSFFASGRDFLWDLQNGTPGLGERNLYLLLNTAYQGDYAGTGINTLDGVAGDPIGGTFVSPNGLDLSQTTDSNGDYANIASSIATTGLVYGPGGAGSNYAGLTHYAGPSYQTVWLGVNFPSGLTIQSQRDALMANILGQLYGADVPWLATSIPGGSIPPNAGTLGWTTIFTATPAVGIPQPGQYFATLGIRPNVTGMPQKNLPVILTVQPSATMGLLQGTVTSDRPGGPLTADILIDNGAGFTVTLTTDPVTGSYSYWLEQGSYAVSASAAGYLPQTTNVTVPPGGTATQDFLLLLAAPDISITPPSLEISLQMGLTGTQTLSVANTGQELLDFAFYELPGGFLPGVLGGGPDPFGYTYRDSNDAGGAVFSWIDATDGTPLNLTDDAEANIVLPFAFTYYGASSTDIRVANNGAVLFGVTTGDVPTTNANLGTTTLNQIIAPFWDDIDADTGNVFYKFIGVAPHRIAVIEWFDRPHFSNVGSATFELLLYEGTHNIKFQYLDTVFDNPSYDYGISATSGIRQVTPNYLQYSFNQAVLQNNMAICFRYPGSGPCDALDVPWVMEEPISGTVPVGGSMNVNVTFDASGVAEPGTYTATLEAVNNDPLQSVVQVPLSMHVLPSPDMGRVQGIVTGLGYCDAATYPLTADILIESSSGVTWTITADPTGFYGRWLLGDVYTLTFAAADHLGALAEVTVTPQMTTTLDMALRWLEPCVSTQPDSLSVSLLQGLTQTLPLDLFNDGALGTAFELLEIDGGFTPAPLSRWVPEQLTGVYDPQSVAEQVGAPAPATLPPAALADPFVPQDVLWDNGPLVTHPGGGSGGADASALQTALGMDTYGFGHQFPSSYRVADDFVISDPGGWQVDSLIFYAYQTGSPTNPSPITGLYYQIWDGAPDDPSSQVVFGDLTTNRLASSSWMNAYRVLDTGLTDTARPIMATTASAGVYLPMGTYWVEWMAEGTAPYTGPWAPPITILGQVTTGNAKQYTTSWADIVDGGTFTPQGMPFTVQGSVMGTEVWWVYENPVTGTLPADSSLSVDVTFVTTDTTPAGLYTATLWLRTADPQWPVIHVPLSMEVTVFVPVYGVDLNPEDSSGVGLPGGVLTYTFTLTNLGNITDTIGLSFSGVDPGWIVSLPVSSFTLAAGESTDLTAIVTIPAGALDGDFDSFTLTATSGGDAAQFDDVAVTTTVDIPLRFVYLPVVLKQ